MKKRKIIFIIILIVGVLIFTSIFYFNSKSKTLESTSKKTLEKKAINKSKNKSSENKNTTKNQTTENKEKSSEKQESSKKDSTNKNFSKKNNSNSSNQSNNNTSQSSNNNSSTQSQNQTTSQQVQTSPKVQTEWERLGISEYDYYNTPSHNEGELAFKGAISQCTNEKNRLINLYYDKGIDGGREYTINGEYTHSYLGCGLNIIMNGRSYKYSEIIAMEKQGYFNKST